MESYNIFQVLFPVWAMTTVAWIVLGAFRVWVGRLEQVLVYLASGDAQVIKSQKEITKLAKRVSRLSFWSGIVSIALLASLATVWVYQGLKAVN